MLVHVRSGLFCAVMLCLAAACETGATPGEETTAQDPAMTGAEREGQAYPYEVFLYDVVADTLRGNAAFGWVLDRSRGSEQLVIQLETGGGYAGGLYVMRQDTLLPEVGTYELADASQPDTTLPPGSFVLIYREGLSRRLASTGGRLTFSTVSDTLIAGSFDALLRGRMSDAGGLPSEREVRARGTFRARPSAIGYFVGL